MKSVVLFSFFLALACVQCNVVDNDPHIIVVGAGPAGIAAITRLHLNGFSKVTVLEAQDRIGGRINTVPFGKNIVDLGAQWCHGQEGNIVYSLVKDLDLVEHSTFMDSMYLLHPGGHVVPPEQSNALDLLYYTLTEAGFDEYTSNDSVGHLFTTKYREAIKDKAYEGFDTKLTDEYLELFHKLENSLTASDNWWESSAKGWQEYKDCEGDRTLNWKDKGYKTILDVLLRKIAPAGEEPLPLDSHILLGKEVVNIDWQQPNGVKVHCADGTDYEGAHVIVTTSLGVLKEKMDSMFTPALPEEKQTVINGLGFGTVNKLILEFSEPWWPNDWTGVKFLWTDEEKAKLKAGEYGADAEWMQDVLGFHTMQYNPNILIGWLSGPSARAMEKLPLEQVKTQCLQLVNLFSGSNFNPSTTVDMTRSAWHSNPHVRGSYSYRTLESERVGANAELLGAPIKHNDKDVLLFAGEATHPIYFSTVHGAISSGYREADRLIELYRH